MYWKSIATQSRKAAQEACCDWCCEAIDIELNSTGQAPVPRYGEVSPLILRNCDSSLRVKSMIRSVSE